MLPAILIILGASLMLIGTFTLLVWVGGKGGWLASGLPGQSGRSRNERQLLDLYYIATVVLPLLSGAVMLVLGLRRWL